jgi:hypothetical protein
MRSIFLSSARAMLTSHEHAVRVWYEYSRHLAHALSNTLISLPLFGFQCEKLHRINSLLWMLASPD